MPDTGYWIKGKRGFIRESIRNLSSLSFSPKGFILGAGLIGLLFMVTACGSEKAYHRGAGGGSLEDLIDKDNTWRGGAIGAGLSKPLKGRISEIAARTSAEAAQDGRPTAYSSLDGFQRVEAYPLEKGAKHNCRQVREQIYQDEKLVLDETKEVCP